jgi:hypothetical protein
MASPFRNNKKARKRFRKKAQQNSAWADRHSVAGTMQQWAIEGMRQSAAFWTRFAQSKRKKRSPSRPTSAG